MQDIWRLKDLTFWSENKQKKPYSQISKYKILINTETIFLFAMLPLHALFLMKVKKYLNGTAVIQKMVVLIFVSIQTLGGI